MSLFNLVVKNCLPMAKSKFLTTFTEQANKFLCCLNTVFLHGYMAKFMDEHILLKYKANTCKYFGSFFERFSCDCQSSYFLLLHKVILTKCITYK